MKSCLTAMKVRTVKVENFGDVWVGRKTNQNHGIAGSLPEKVEG